MSISKAVFLLTLALTGQHAFGHLLIALPSTWGLTLDLENPLNANTPNWFCHGRTRDTNVFTTIQAGSTFSAPIVCGEAIGNPNAGGTSCANDPNAYHGGGGCALSIAYKTNPTINDFTMFSVQHDCPKLGQALVPFQVPANLPQGDAVCSWTWIPDPNASANEMYMNCFNCRISGSTSGTISSGTRLSNHIFAVPGAPSVSGPRPLYKNVLPNGALALQVSGGTSSTSSSTRTSSSSTSSTSTRTTSSTIPTTGTTAPTLTVTVTGGTRTVTRTVTTTLAATTVTSTASGAFTTVITRTRTRTIIKNVTRC